MIVIDTSAWIEYLSGTIKGEVVKKAMEKEDGLTPSVVLIELSCKLDKKEHNFQNILNFIKSKTTIIGIKEKTIIKCGELYIEERKKETGFSMIDAVILAIAEENNAKIITKDNHFKDFKGVILLK